MSTLHQLLHESAERFPQREAVRDPLRDTRISYRDLAACANKVREAIDSVGFIHGDRVGICAPKSIGTVAGIFGVLEALGTYVPVDSEAPAQRNAYIFEDCSVRAVIADRGAVEGLQVAWGGDSLVHASDLDFTNQYGANLVLLDAGPSDDAARPPERGTPDAREDAGSDEAPLSYILYTSGSTGKPKGVMHNHRTALSFVDWCSTVFEPTEKDRFSSHAPFHFDLSILDLYVPLKHGASLVLFGESLGKQPGQLAKVIAEEGITAWYSTPSILRLIVEYGQLDEKDFSALRIVNFAGEVFPIKHLLALKALWPNPRYFNLYGPTETNVCTYYEVPDTIDPNRTEPFPIGIKCSRNQTRVIGLDGREANPGEEGELQVYGGSVMLGYWNLPERNAEAFVIDDDGRAWHKTGDVVREDANGDYLFIGRRDRMVKRRGYRVELGEIEAALHRHESISEAAVIAVPDEEGGVVVRAFYAWTGDSAPSIIALKQFCTKHLPLYMIPDSLSVQPSLPKTSTDKIDYQKLKELK